MELDYLILAAHPDDAELYCGGTLIKMRQLGYQVGILDFTRGEAGTSGSAEERALETDAANSVLQCAFRDNLQLPDGKLRDDDQTRAMVVNIIRQHKVKILIAPVSSCRHPDHSAVSAIAQSAHFFAGAGKFASPHPPWRPHQVIFHLEYEDAAPSFVIDISDQFEAKMSAIEAYGSQFFTDSNQQEKTVVSSRRFRERMISRFKFYGNLVGCDYGEPFVVNEMIRIDDPLRHLTTLTSGAGL